MRQVPASTYVEPLARLLVRFGANVQPGQVVGLGTEPGKEQLARAVAAEAYRAGAKFVDVQSFDMHVKRARALYADPESLAYVPPWIGERVLALGRLRGAMVVLTSPSDPHLMDGIDPELLGRDMLPHVRESSVVLAERTVNWTIGPCPTAEWAALAYPELGPRAALERLWEEIAHICRLDEPDPVTAWEQRMGRLLEVAAKLDRLGLDRLRYEGPGTDLTVGLLPGSRWQAARLKTVDGVLHAANIPTEEVFTTPDPQRAEGVVAATRPLFSSGALIEGLRVRFEAGRAVEIEAERNAGTLRALSERDPGGIHLGEVALVDRESRVGQLRRVFFETLLDENAASHIALGQGFPWAVAGEDRERINRSEIHVDFMIGSDELAVTGVTAAGEEVPLLCGGRWQI
jgi:aminopeptidase